MIIIGIADIHGDVSSINPIFDSAGSVDITVLSGDLTHFGGERIAGRVIDAVRNRCERILAVSGNCDYEEVESLLVREGLNLHGRGVVVDGVGFVGSGKSLPCPGTTPNEAPDEALGAWLQDGMAAIPEGIPTILVVHQPPFDTITDLTTTGLHVGSREIRQFIENQKPLICFTGHIHEGKGVDRIGTTQIVNPGPSESGSYAYAEINSEVEILEIRSL